MPAIHADSARRTRRSAFVGSSLIALSLAFSGPAPARHGGGHTPPSPTPPPEPWKGPGDTRGPGRGPAGPGGPGPATPGTPGPSAPGPGPYRPAPVGAPTTLGAGGVDASDWRVWWELEQHTFLALRDALAATDPESPGARFALGAGVHDPHASPMRPDDALLLASARPALLRALESDGQPDVVSSALTALAKLGELAPADGGPSNAEIVGRFLADPNQQTSETAALALGILGAPASTQVLASLVRDDEAGREHCGRAAVPERTRAFAAVGLGLFARDAAISDQRRYAVHELVSALERDASSSHDLAVACFNALSLARLPDGPAPAEGEPASPALTRAGLASYLQAQLASEDLAVRVQAHVPRALAAVSAEVPELADAAAKVIAERLGDRDATRELRAGCAQALGLVGTAGGDPLDQQVREALFAALAKGAPDERGLTMIALGRIAARPRGDGPEAWKGARAISDRLAEELARGKGSNRPWAALALGVQGHGLLARGLTLAEATSAALRLHLSETGDPLEAGACALALGLRRDLDSIEQLISELERFSDDDARGTIALALGLIGEAQPREVLRSMIDYASYRPALMRNLVVSLALLREPALVPDLVARLAATDSSSVRAVYAYALAFVGDRRALEPLAALLSDEDAPALTRGNAALGLGWISERTRLPWSAELARCSNYLATTESLWSPTGGGILNVR